jgi:nuclear transport factor 2 (NTF2) superfamily protein
VVFLSQKIDTGHAQYDTDRVPVAYTEDDLTAVRAALLKGERRVQFADREVEYRSVTELQKVEQAIIAELSIATPRRKQFVITGNKGL